jgi:ubiquinone/menaquinone biosynthesis C-methylase UbiE
MKKRGPERSEDRIFFIERQEVTVADFDASGWILDIGGGGEGIIGQMKGAQVVAIDPSRRELEEAAAGPLKIVMDARDLLFLDGAFDVVTSFFTLMYLAGTEHEKVFEEVFRVLASGGRFLIWDADIPQRLEEVQDVVAFYLTVRLPDREIETGYGTKWPTQAQGLPYYREMAERIGFSVSDEWENERVFYLELRKPLEAGGKRESG